MLLSTLFTVALKRGWRKEAIRQMTRKREKSCLGRPIEVFYSQLIRKEGIESSLYFSQDVKLNLKIEFEEERRIFQDF